MTADTVVSSGSTEPGDTNAAYRIEHDTMGEVRVPKNALYAAQTQRAVENFPISGDRLEPAQIVALARIKKAAALANKELGTLDGAIADAIAEGRLAIVGANYRLAEGTAVPDVIVGAATGDA